MLEENAEKLDFLLFVCPISTVLVNGNTGAGHIAPVLAGMLEEHAEKLDFLLFVCPISTV
jgi:hypothetical protein